MAQNYRNGQGYPLQADASKTGSGMAPELKIFENVKDCGEGNSFSNTFHRIFYQVWVSK
jgi:hypothetical protein